MNTSIGLCHCGCGNKTPIATRTYRDRKMPVYKGSSLRFIRGHNLSFDGYKEGMPGNKWNLGRKHSIKTRLKLSAIRRGKKHWNWQGGKGTERHRLMHQLEYKLWRDAVFTRDNWTCVTCSKTNCYLEADHIKPWALYPELRYAIDNGRTLCKPCHQETETYPITLRGRSLN